MENSMDIKDDEFTTVICSICLNCFNRNHTIRNTICGHVFHAVCLKSWQDRSNRCPICRTDNIKVSALYLNFDENFTFLHRVDELKTTVITYKSKIDDMYKDLNDINENFRIMKKKYICSEETNRKLQLQLNKYIEEETKFHSLNRNYNILEDIIHKIKILLNDFLKTNNNNNNKKNNNDDLMNIMCGDDKPIDMSIKTFVDKIDFIEKELLAKLFTKDNELQSKIHEEDTQIDILNETKKIKDMPNMTNNYSIVIKKLSRKTLSFPLMKFVLSLGQDMGIKLINEDIKYVYIINNNNNNNNNNNLFTDNVSLCIGFINSFLKDQFLQKKYKLPAYRKLLIHEYLDHKTYTLFTYAKKKLFKYGKIFSNNGDIYIMPKNSASNGILIRNSNEVNTLYESYINSASFSSNNNSNVTNFDENYYLKNDESV